MDTFLIFIILALICFLICFNIAIVFGAPLGNYCGNGTYGRKLPKTRRINAIFLVVCLIVSWVVVSFYGNIFNSSLDDKVIEIFMIVIVSFFGLNMFANMGSRSIKAKILFTPIYAILFLSGLVVILT